MVRRFKPKFPGPGRGGLGWALAATLGLPAQQPAPSPKPLEEFSLEELGSIDITSVSKRPESLAHAPAAVYVITREDIRRSGATTLPEVLRLAPNLQVAQMDSSQYVIGARGLNISNVNKLLVLIDGRVVYSALHSGVFWDAQDTLLTDIERIEVIAGPGGTLWGLNAVNGVIKLLTRSSNDPQPSLLAAAAGDEDRRLGVARHGGRLSENATYRVYGKYLERDATVGPKGTSAQDDWHRAQGGFRVDWARGSDTLTIQGDAYRALVNQPTLEDRRLDGANLLARWGRTWSADSALEVQVYLDRAHRRHPTLFEETADTFDFDVQHRFSLGEGQSIGWGGGYRSLADDITNSSLLAFLPAQKELRLANVFAQDSVALVPDALTLTLGTKLEHNVYTGWEVQPSARLAWIPDSRQFLWAAVSRVVRTPSRLDADFYVNFPPYLVFQGGPGFRSESMVAYEAGYRAQLGPRFSWSFSPYYDVYKDVRSVEKIANTPPTYVLANKIEGHAYGAEVWGEVRVTEAWRLKPGYAYLRTSFHTLPGSTDTSGGSSVGNDARHRFLLTSYLSLGPSFDVDGTLRHVSALPNPAVPAYWALDLRLGWRPVPPVEISLVGQNLLDARHPEFGPASSRNEIEHGAMVKIQWSF